MALQILTGIPLDPYRITNTDRCYPLYTLLLYSTNMHQYSARSTVQLTVTVTGIYLYLHCICSSSTEFIFSSLRYHDSTPEDVTKNTPNQIHNCHSICHIFSCTNVTIVFLSVYLAIPSGLDKIRSTLKKTSSFVLLIQDGVPSLYLVTGKHLVAENGTMHSAHTSSEKLRGSGSIRCLDSPLETK